jgi:sec-independent protein translocase protein TatA
MGIGFREILVILVIVLLVFGTKKLKTIGSDLGGAVRGFKKAMSEGEAEQKDGQQADASKQLEAPALKDAEFPEAKHSNQKSGQA